MLIIGGSIIGGLFTVYGTVVSVVTSKKWKELGAKKAIWLGLTWPRFFFKSKD